MRIDKTSGLLCTSHSEIAAFTECEMMHYKRYVKGYRSRGPHLAYGIAFDDVVTGVLNQLIAGQKPETVDQAVEWEHEEFNKQYDKLDVTERLFAPSREEFQETGERHIRQFYDLVLPKLQPAAVQHKTILELPGGYGIKGYIDYMDQRGFLIDWKTTGNPPGFDWTEKRKWLQKNNLDDTRENVALWKKSGEALRSIDPKYRMQVITYLVAMQYNHGYLVHFIKKNKSARPVRQHVLVEDIEQATMNFIELIFPVVAKIADVVENGVEPLQTGRYKEIYNAPKCGSCELRKLDPVCKGF